MKRWIWTVALLFVSASSGSSKVVVFWQDRFPAVESQAVPKETLLKALGDWQVEFAGLGALQRPETLKEAELLVLPYGSALPVEGWKAIQDYLEAGGNMLTLGGRPLSVPVREEDGQFIQASAGNSYSRHLSIWHSYEVPQREFNQFAWDDSYSFFTARELRARRTFVAATWWDRAHYQGMGFLLDKHGKRVAAPVVKQDFIDLRPEGQTRMLGARVVTLNFEPELGYWSSPEGVRLIREAAAYAMQGATLFWLEMQFATVAEGELPQLVVHLRNVRRQRLGVPQSGNVRVELLSDNKVVASTQVKCSGDTVAEAVAFQRTLPPGLYFVRGIYEDGGKVREIYQTGFWRRHPQRLKQGSALAVSGDYFQKGGAPFLPFGTNYFTTDPHRGNFWGAANAYVWERDLAEMQADGITMVRTGVWHNQADLLDKVTGGVQERFLRGLEAFLLCAGRHNLQVNFTFYAFDPLTVRRYPGETPLQFGPGTNPYTDPVALRAQKNYILSVVGRFKDVPYLSWDLINEPSFSNPNRLWIGNTPKGDPTELAAWNQWLSDRYGSFRLLAEAWNTTPQELGDFGRIPLPDAEDLQPSRYGNARHVRAIDYNLFAQEMFNRWAREMVSAIRSTGSTQLVTVGQDEGGVTNRLLTQFYGGAGVDFTVNHTWWQDDALLWDSVAAKRPSVPNLIGETGIQPVWRMDGTWRWDEVHGLGLFERKLALGLAAANSGSLQWDWANEDVFGIKRGDGSDKLWREVLAAMAKFARAASRFAAPGAPPAIAVVLPQSLQLSVFNRAALEAQQKCVRALYHYARASAYMVGEYQIELLGNPQLIILPSPSVLSQKAWEAILRQVEAGATLLFSGRFDGDEHFRPIARAEQLGLSYHPGLLATRENLVRWPSGRAWLSYAGEKTTYLERGCLAGDETFARRDVGKGQILYCPLPIELNDNLEAIGELYRLAISDAGISPAYATDADNPGILICPTQWAQATLYVLTSESSVADFSFRDNASGRQFAVHLDPGRAALLLVSNAGEVLASYNWQTSR